MGVVKVLSTKWGTKYGADDVNRLRSMVGRHLQRPFRFVCLTGDAQGNAANVEVFGLPAVGFADFDQRRPWSKGHGCLKLTSFAAPLYDPSGPTLCIDLDLVIVGDQGPFFDLPCEFLVIKEWDKRGDTGNTSVYRCCIGAHADLITPLAANKDAVLRELRNEQESVTQTLSRQGRLACRPQAGCRSVKRHGVRRGPLQWCLPPQIPPGARVTACHGKPKPPDSIAGISGKWYRPVLPSAWAAEHWR
jgi:hypothetical protein